MNLSFCRSNRDFKRYFFTFSRTSETWFSMVTLTNLKKCFFFAYLLVVSRKKILVVRPRIFLRTELAIFFTKIENSNVTLSLISYFRNLFSNLNLNDSNNYFLCIFWLYMKSFTFYGVSTQLKEGNYQFFSLNWNSEKYFSIVVLNNLNNSFAQLLGAPRKKLAPMARALSFWKKNEFAIF